MSKIVKKFLVDKSVQVCYREVRILCNSNRWSSISISVLFKVFPFDRPAGTHYTLYIHCIHTHVLEHYSSQFTGSKFIKNLEAQTIASYHTFQESSCLSWLIALIKTFWFQSLKSVTAIIYGQRSNLPGWHTFKCVQRPQKRLVERRRLWQDDISDKTLVTVVTLFRSRLRLTSIQKHPFQHVPMMSRWCPDDRLWWDDGVIMTHFCALHRM